MSTTRRVPRDWARFVVLAALAVTIAIALTRAARESDGIQFALMDVASVARAGIAPPFYTGWLSYAGIVCWVGAGTVAIMAAWISRPGRAARFLVGAGVLSLLLGIDDLLMLHDGASGVPEELIFGLYGALVVSWTLVYFPEITRNADLPVLALAMLAFGYAVLADITDWGFSSIVHEDAAKLAAVFLWSTWLWATAARALTAARRIGRAETSPVAQASRSSIRS